jgi:ketosteroid isomerase-like protein
MAIDPIALVKRYHDALNQFDATVVEPMLSPDASYHSPSVGVIPGRDAIIAAMTGYFAEYPDQIANDEKVELAGPNKVRCEWQLRATAKSTGEPYERQGIEFVTFDDEGRVLRVEVEDK